MGLTFTELKTSDTKLSHTPLPILLILIVLLCISGYNAIPLSGQSLSVLLVSKTDDFTITGDGLSQNWSGTNWIELSQRTNHENDSGRKTFVKVLYSETGIYFLFQCEDNLVSATITSHFEQLWREDVVEVFLWPNEGEEVYFEYELSPLNYELPILVSKTSSGQSHWIPFEYSYKDGESRKTIHKTFTTGGSLESGEAISEWKAEFFIPFDPSKKSSSNAWYNMACQYVSSRLRLWLDQLDMAAGNHEFP